MADRRAQLEERRRKLEELKRAKEAPGTVATSAAFAPPPIPVSSLPTAPSSSIAAPSSSPTASSVSVAVSSTSIEPLLSDLLSSGPVIETPALDAQARAKRLNALAHVPDVVHVTIGSGASDGSAGMNGPAKFPAAFYSCEAGIQTEEDADDFLSSGLSGSHAGRPLDEASAAALLGSPNFNNFLASAVSVLEEQMAGLPAAREAAQTKDSARSLQQEQQPVKEEVNLSVLAKLFQQSVDSAASTIDTSASGGLGPGFSPIITLLEVPATIFPTSSSSSAGSSNTKQPLMPCLFPEGAPISDVAWSNFAQGTLAVSYTTSKAKGIALEQYYKSQAGGGGDDSSSLFQSYLKTVAARFNDVSEEGDDSSKSQQGSSGPPPIAAVLIWNMAASDYPLAALTLGPAANAVAALSGGGGLGSDVCSLRFHPHAPHLLLGGTNAGQLLVWDLKGAGIGKSTSGSSTSGLLPVLEPIICSGFTGGTHVNALSAMLVAGTAASAASSLLLTLSGEGRACQWSGVISQAANAASAAAAASNQEKSLLGILASSFLEPSSSSKLTYIPETVSSLVGGPAGAASAVGASPLSGASGTAGASSTATAPAGARDIPVSCASFSSADPSRLYIGGQEGALYISLYGGSATQIQTQARLPAHYTCISSLAPHPSRDVPLLLTCSYDGTIKLWNTEVSLGIDRKPKGVFLLLCELLAYSSSFCPLLSSHCS
jgi:WD domain, G-beta repeat